MPAKKRLGVGRIIFEILLLYLFSGLMLDLGPITAIVYLFSITMAIITGILFKRRYIGWMIVFGTLIGYIGGKFIVKAFNNILAGDITGAIIVGIVAFSLWYTGTKLRKGK